MAYEKQDWTTGDVITAEKLNHMEDGISNALTEVDASELVDSNSLIKSENNKLDIKYSELKGDIATDITAGSNYIDDVNGKIDVDYNSLKAALDADLLTDNDSTLSTMCEHSNYIEVSNGVLDVSSSALTTAIKNTSGLSGAESSQDSTYGDYVEFVLASSDHYQVPTIGYVQEYVSTQSSGGKGNMYFSFNENGGGETPTPMFQYYPSGEEYPSYISCVPIIRKDINIGEDIPVLCYQETNGQLGILNNVVYHDSDGFYTVDGTGNRQSITV